MNGLVPIFGGGSGGGNVILTIPQQEYLADVADNDTIGLILAAIAVSPTYVAPTANLNQPTTPVEIGSTVAISLTQTFTQNDAGAKTSEQIRKNGTPVSTTNTFTENLVVPTSPVNYQGTINFAQGAVKNNNLGIPDPTGRINAGSVNTPTRTVTGIYPVFVLKRNTPITAQDMADAIAAGQATKLVVSSTGTITVPYAPNAEYVAVAYPATSTTKTRWYVTELSQGAIPGGVFGVVTQLAVDSPTSIWSNVQFKIHVTPLLTNTGATNIQLRNS